MIEQKKASDSMRAHSLTHLWPWMLLPVLPLWMALVTLKLLADDGFYFTAQTQAAFISELSGHFIHLKDLMVYSSFACLHAIVCLLVMVYFLLQIRNLPAVTRRAVWRLSFVLLGFLVLTTIAARIDGTAQHLTYANVCKMLKQAKAATTLLPEACIGGPPSLLFTLATFPTVSGILAPLLVGPTSDVLGRLLG